MGFLDAKAGLLKVLLAAAALGLLVPTPSFAQG